MVVGIGWNDWVAISTIQHVALEGKFWQYLRRPLTELGCPYRVHAIASGNNGIEIVVISLVINPSCAFFLNY